MAENHQSLFNKQAEELARLDRIQDEFRILQEQKLLSVHALIKEMTANFQSNLELAKADIQNKMDNQEAEGLRRHEKVEEQFADIGKEIQDLDRRSSKADANIKANLAAIHASKEETEAGFSEVAEKQRVNDQTHLAIKQDLCDFQTQTEQNLVAIRDRLTEIGVELEVNTKDHDKFVHDINKNKVNLSKHEETTKMELATMTQNHEDLKNSHDRLNEEVEENIRLERENGTRVNKNLRELGNQAETIERNLELLDCEVRKHESSRKNNETSIKNKLELITTQQAEHSHILAGLEDRLVHDEEKIEENKTNFDLEVEKLNEKNRVLGEDLDSKHDKSVQLIESVQSSLSTEITTQFKTVQDACQAENEIAR